MCLYGSLCLGVVAFLRTDPGDFSPFSAFYLCLNRVGFPLENSAVWFGILCWHGGHTHLPSSMRRGRTSRPHVESTGFAAVLLSPQCPPGVQPPWGVRLPCHGVVNENCSMWCVVALFLYSYLCPFFFSASRLQTIFSRFDEALNSGNMALSPSHGQSILSFIPYFHQGLRKNVVSWSGSSCAFEICACASVCICV